MWKQHQLNQAMRKLERLIAEDDLVVVHVYSKNSPDYRYLKSELPPQR
jgi:hypothetical protein